MRVVLIAALLVFSCTEKQKATSPSQAASSTRPAPGTATHADATSARQTLTTPAEELRMDNSIVSLALVSALWGEADQRWTLLVDLTFTNRGETLFDLDKVTACFGGRMSNMVFSIYEGGQKGSIPRAN